MFKNTKEKIDLQQLLEESQAQLLAARSGNFNYELNYTTNNEQLQQIIDNFNEVNALQIFIMR